MAGSQAARHGELRVSSLCFFPPSPRLDKETMAGSGRTAYPGSPSGDTQVCMAAGNPHVLSSMQTESGWRGCGLRAQERAHSFSSLDSVFHFTLLSKEMSSVQKEAGVSLPLAPQTQVRHDCPPSPPTVPGSDHSRCHPLSPAWGRDRRDSSQAGT